MNYSSSRKGTINQVTDIEEYRQLYNQFNGIFEQYLDHIVRFSDTRVRSRIRITKDMSLVYIKLKPAARHLHNPEFPLYKRREIARMCSRADEVKMLITGQLKYLYDVGEIPENCTEQFRNIIRTFG